MDTVDTYIAKHPKWNNALNTLRALVLEFPFQENIKWNAPVYTACGRNLVGMAAFKNHFSLWFYEGYLLDDPYQHLENAQEGKTKYLRQWKFKDTSEINATHIRHYLNQTLELAAANEPPKPSKVKETGTPALSNHLLEEALIKDDTLRSAFASFPPYKQRAFSQHITEAKRESTKHSRLEKVLDLIRNGQGLNDKYRK